MWNVATNIRHSAPENSLQMLVVNQHKQFRENASVALQQTIIIDACAYKMPSCSAIQNVNQKLQVQYTIMMTAKIISGWITDDCEYIAFFLMTGLPELCVFFRQIMCYFLANYASKIPNYAQIVQYCTIFLSKSSQCFNLLSLQIKHKHLINI